MDATNTTSQNDVLHFENHSKLSAEEIAKAIAHHKRHHAGNQQQNAPANAKTGKRR